LNLASFFKIPVALIFFCSFAHPESTSGQDYANLIHSRILILLDGSGSMRQSFADGSEKFKTGCEIIGRIMDSVYAVNKDAEFSLRVFGHQHPVSENDCSDTKNEVPFGRNNKAAIVEHLKAIHPLGVSPIAYSLKEAAEKDITDEMFNAYSIILITDGVESCNGEICVVMRSLINRKVFFRPYIIGLETGTALKKDYDCMGEYLKISNEGEKAATINTIVKAVTPALKITETEYGKLMPDQTRPNVPCSILAKSTAFEMQKNVKRIPGIKEFAVENFSKPVPGHIRLSNGDAWFGHMTEYGLKTKGIYTWLNGEKYKGEFKDNRKNGNGTYYWPNGDVFEGEWVNDEPVKGILRLAILNENMEPDTATFQGNFVHGSLDGYAVEKSNLFNYEGNWQQNKKWGNGVATWADGRKYDGQWSNDKRNGHGTYVLANGDRYEGEWKDNMKSGKATVELANGNKYEGVYTNDRLAGHVVYSYSNGDKYEGNYKDDSMSGHGVYTFAAGDKYEGEWKSNVKNGHGIFTSAKGETYDGNWKNDVQEGYGTYIWSPGEKYTGDWKNNLRDGYGTCTWADGSKYVGHWKNGKMNGVGVYTTAKGKRYDGNWEDDVFKGQPTK
jgi:hypothetical protein